MTRGDVALSEAQRQIHDEVVRFLEGEEPRGSGSRFGPLSNVVAICGGRGTGKTTLLSRIREKLEGSPGLLCTQIIDAATIDEDLGIAAAVIQALHRLATEHGQTASKEMRSDLEEAYRDCLKSALSLEEPYRALAKDMAMSAEHYMNLVAGSTVRRLETPEKWLRFLKCIRQVVPARSARLVVLLDDLDLGPLRAVGRWVRAMVDRTLEGAAVMWVTAFDRDRFVTCLSPRELRLADGRAERSSVVLRDDVIGDALLAKLVPFERQHMLRSWPSSRRSEFRNLQGSQSVGELLVRAGRTELLAALPSHPRGLESLHSWLIKELEHTKTIPSFELVQRLATLRGEPRMAHLLEQGPARWVGLLEWDKEATLGSAAWSTVVSSAATDNAMWGVPIPPKLGEVLRGNEPEGLLEALLDLALADGYLTPYQLLLRMPFAVTRLNMAIVKSAFVEAETIRFMDRRWAGTDLGFDWQEWSEEAVGGSWEVTIGPQHMWRVQAGIRRPEPEGLLRALFLPRPATDGSVAKGVVALPKSFRALVLLIDALASMPWPQLASTRRIWSPLAFTRSVAALTLSAYAQAAGVPVDRAEFITLDEGGVGVQYGVLVEKLTAPGNGTSGGEERPTGDSGPTLASAARAKLRSALFDLVAWPGVQRLRPAAAAT